MERRHQKSDIKPNFQNRAAQLNRKVSASRDVKTGPKLQQKQPTKVPIPSLTGSKKYWQENVRTKADVVEFYKLYYPHYPDVLIQAISERLEQLLLKANSGLELSADENRMLKQGGGQDSTGLWIPADDIEEQKLAGKINLATKRLDALMKDEK